MMKTITIQAPGTIANLVCGFDILGLSLEAPCDTIELTLSDEPGIRIKHTDTFGLPEAWERNVAGVSLKALADACNYTGGFEMKIHKGIKPGSGLGSSAASAAGAVVAASHLLGNPFNNAALVRFAMEGEALASGVRHADNVAPCIYGGVTLVRDGASADIIPLDAPPMFISVVHPQIEVRTSDARQILRREVLLKDAIKQWGNIAALVAGLLQHDYALIGRSLEDVIVEPVRSILIPGFDAVKAMSKNEGVIGGGIAGSGPSLFLLCKEAAAAEAVAVQMKAIYEALEIGAEVYVTRVGKGCRVVEG
jgi:homoserine kinase